MVVFANCFSSIIKIAFLLIKESKKNENEKFEEVMQYGDIVLDLSGFAFLMSFLVESLVVCYVFSRQSVFNSFVN